MNIIYYVSDVGNDNNDGLSLITAWYTIQKAVDIAENGDTVYVTGTYTMTNSIDITKSGNQNGWIKFYGGNTTILNGNNSFSAFSIQSGTSYLIFDGFRLFDYINAFSVGDISHHLTFSNNYIKNHSGTAIGSWKFGNNITVDGNYIEGNGGADSRAVFSFGFPYDFNDFVTDIRIVNNTMINHGHNSIDIHTRHKNVWIENNTISYATNSAAIMLHNFGVYNVTIKNNRISHSNYGLYIVGSENVIIEDNIIDTYPIDKAGILFLVEDTSWYAPNNGITQRTESSNITIKNNIINSTQDYSNAIRFLDISTEIDPDPIFDNFIIDGNNFLNSFNKPDIYAESSFPGSIQFLNSKDLNNNTIIYGTKSGKIYSDALVRYTDNTVITANMIYTYYPTYAEGIVPINGVSTIVYPMNVIPTTESATCTLNFFNTALPKGSTLVDYNIITTDGNGLTSIIKTLKPNTEYSIQIAGIQVTTGISNNIGNMSFNLTNLSSSNRITINEIGSLACPQPLCELIIS